MMSGKSAKMPASYTKIEANAAFKMRPSPAPLPLESVTSIRQLCAENPKKLRHGYPKLALNLH